RAAPAATRHAPQRRQRRSRLIVAQARAEQCIESPDLRQGLTLRLSRGQRVRTTATSAAISISVRAKHRQDRLTAQAGTVRRIERADIDFANALETLSHDFHVRGHDPLAQAAEFFDVLLVDHLTELVPADLEFIQQRRDREKRAEERIALHTQLQVGAIGGIARNLETWKREDADLLFDDLLARP